MKLLPKKNSSSITSVCVLVAVLCCLESNASSFQDGFANLSRENCFMFPAVAMTPYDDSIHQKLYRMTHGSVYHRDDNIGEILLYGPVLPLQQVNHFYATFVDPDGRGDKSSVKAELRFVGKTGIEIVASLDSNNDSVATDKVRTMSTHVSPDQLKKSGGYYIVRVYIDRTDSSIKPISYGYAFCWNVY